MRKVTQREEQLQWHLARSQRPPQRLRGRPVPKSPPQTPPRVQASPSRPAAARGHRHPRGQGTGKILIHPKSREPNPLFPGHRMVPTGCFFFFLFKFLIFFRISALSGQGASSSPEATQRWERAFGGGGGLTEQHHQLLVMPISSSGTAPAPQQEEEEALNSWSTRPR